MAHADIRSGVVLAVVSIAYLAGTIGLISDPVDAGPGLLPVFLGALLFTFAMITLARGIRAAASAVQAPVRDHERPHKAWLAIVLTLLYVLAFNSAGFAASTLAYTFAMTFLFKGDRPKYLLLVPPLSTAAIYLFFRVALGARLPVGLLG